MAFLASISIIGILNIASCHVNFPLLEALIERFNYQTNTFFLPTGETTLTLEEISMVSELNLVGIAYPPSTATENNSITGVQLLGAAYSPHGQWVDMELLFPYSFSPCHLGESGLHHYSGLVGGNLPRSS
ncbi:hypothetical protein AMTRI_Chr01g130920 [Amborella trichopoda]